MASREEAETAERGGTDGHFDEYGAWIDYD